MNQFCGDPGIDSQESRSDSADEIRDLRQTVDRLEQTVKDLTQVSRTDCCSAIQEQQYTYSPTAIDLASLEGDSSFRRQALLAVEITQVATIAGAQSPCIVDTLSNLQQRLESCSPREEESPPGLNHQQGVAALRTRLPPADFVITLLRAVKGMLAHPYLCS